MLLLHDYTLGETLYEGPETCIRRALHHPSGEQVVIKQPISDHPSLHIIGRLVHEHRILAGLSHIPGIVRVRALERSAGSAALVLDDLGQQSLDRVLAKRGRLSFATALRIASGLCQTLDGVHAAGVMHKDVKPQNILVDQACEQVLLIDFGIASDLSHEAMDACIPESLEGTLAYISPEQTGRTARAVDARTDLYSLGVTLFELLVGERPFVEQEPLSLVYAHLARQARRVDELVPEVPPIVAQIVAKLLEKDPDQRYQTAKGVRSDIECVLTQCLAVGKVDSFVLGRKDFSPRLRLPHLLIGRESEVKQVAAAYEHAARGRVELLLIGGPSGIGKTALVRTMYRDIARTGRGLLLAGKHDQLARSTPYAALAQAFGGLMKQWLASPPAVLASWQERIRKEVGDNARLIADVVPELDLVMGHKLAPVPEVQGDQILNRLKLTWLNFIRAVTTPNAPLLLFLDDMQWADSATLLILQTLLTDVERNALLLIAAYRDNETPSEHPLWRLVEASEKSGTVVSRLLIGPLSGPQVHAWLARTLLRDSAEVEPLARVLAHRTRGNPFFLEQLLLSLHRQKQVMRDLESGQWAWNLAAIDQVAVTDNVVALLTNKVQELPDATQHVLGLAACAGHQFQLLELSHLIGWERGRVSAALWPALQEELIVPVDGAYRTAQSMPESEAEGLDAGYRFLHDRVQQASYGRITTEQRALAHLEIGHRLLARYRTEGGTAQQLLELVRHMNLGAERLNSDAERLELARINLDAARRAKAASSHPLMASLLDTAQALLGKEAWRDEPAMATEIAIERLEAAYLLRDFGEVELLSQALLALPLPRLPRLVTQECRARSFMATGQFARGLAVCLSAMAEVGIEFPATEEDCAVALTEWAALDGWLAEHPDAFEHMPSDPSLEHGIIDALTTQTMFCSAFGGRSMLSLLVVVRNIAECRNRGALTLATPFLLGVFAHFGSGAMGKYRRAASWVEVAMRAAERLSSPFIAQVLFFHGVYQTYFRPIDEVVPIFDRSLTVGLKSGSFVGTSFALLGGLVYARAWRGIELSSVLAFLEKARPLMQRAGDAFGQHALDLTAAWCEALQSSDHSTWHSGVEPIKGGSVALLAEGDVVAAELARVLESHLYLATGSYQRALSRATEADLFRSMINGDPPVTDIPLWRGLAAAKCLDPSAPVAEQADLRAQLDQALERFRYFSAGCEQNFLHKLRLLEAEDARINGRLAEAMAKYDEAISLAHSQRFLHIEALAAQFCADFHLQAGRQRIAAMYLRESCDAYVRWGASALSEHLEQRYPALLVSASPGKRTERFRTDATRRIRNDTISSTHSSSDDSFDVVTTVRAAQALSSELNAERVVAQLMQLVQANAGAQRAALVLASEGIPMVGALLSDAQGHSGLAEPLSSAHPIAQSVIQYVLRSRETIVLSDASTDNRFSHDHYLQTTGIRSVLAVPLIHQGRLGGVLYLDHQTANAFPLSRVSLLSVLASQSAIALENSRLYADLQSANAGLEAKVTDRTAALNKALNELWTEMDLASKIQSVLLPPDQTFLSCYEFAGVMKPADEVGGDYYDAFEAGGKLWLLIGDVSGHGVTAGLIMMMVQTAVRSLVVSFATAGLALSPSKLLTLVNRAVWSNLQMIGKGQYMTLNALCISEDQVIYSGMHQTLLVYRKATQRVEEMETEGCWLGMLDDIDGLNQDYRMELNRGDVLLLYTDGLTEARLKDDNSLLGLDPVVAGHVAACREGGSSGMVARSILSLTKEAIVKDDISTIVLRRIEA